MAWLPNRRRCELLGTSDLPATALLRAVALGPPLASVPFNQRESTAASRACGFASARFAFKAARFVALLLQLRAASRCPAGSSL